MKITIEATIEEIMDVIKKTTPSNAGAVSNQVDSAELGKVIAHQLKSLSVLGMDQDYR